MADASELVVTKGEFARMLNVSPGRVSQMISEGKIGADALEGEGRNAKIRAVLARQQISDRTDVGQRTGNGLFTRLDAPPAERPADRAPAPMDPTAAAIARERLRTLQLNNERAAEDRLAEQGRYVPTDLARAAMNKQVQSLLTIFEGGLVDLADAISAKHKLPQRDVLHLLRTEFRVIRAKAADAARRDAAGMPKLIVDDVADASDPAAGEA